jgi:hypothetical protein
MYITFLFILELLDSNKYEDAGALYICTPVITSAFIYSWWHSLQKRYLLVTSSVLSADAVTCVLLTSLSVCLKSERNCYHFIVQQTSGNV